MFEREFGGDRMTFFHLESRVSQFWRSGDRKERLTASLADDMAKHGLNLIRLFHGEGDVFATRRVGAAQGSFNYALETAFMAPKAKPAPTRDSAPEWRGFLEYRLTAEELDDLDSWAPEAAELFERLHWYLTQGYTFTLSWSNRTSQACFSLRDNNPERKTAGYCMTTFDADCALALKAGVFKQSVILKDDWTPFLTAGKLARRG